MLQVFVAATMRPYPGTYPWDTLVPHLMSSPSPPLPEAGEGPSVEVSAPGKVLISGGYLVLEVGAHSCRAPAHLDCEPNTWGNAKWWPPGASVSFSGTPRSTARVPPTDSPRPCGQAWVYWTEEPWLGGREHAVQLGERMGTPPPPLPLLLTPDSSNVPRWNWWSWVR